MYERLFKNVLFPFYETRIKGRKTLQYLKSLERSQWLSYRELKHKQWDDLKRLLAHAYDHSKFYRNHFDQVNLKPEDINNFDDFARLPVISKEEIRLYKDEIGKKTQGIYFSQQPFSPAKT